MTEVETLRAEVKRLREALEPFAREADAYSDLDADDDHQRLEWGAGSTEYTVGDLRRARKALSAKP